MSLYCLVMCLLLIDIHSVLAMKRVLGKPAAKSSELQTQIRHDTVIISQLEQGNARLQQQHQRDRLYLQRIENNLERLKNYKDLTEHLILSTIALSDTHTLHQYVLSTTISSKNHILQNQFYPIQKAIIDALEFHLKLNSTQHDEIQVHLINTDTLNSPEVNNYKVFVVFSQKYSVLTQEISEFFTSVSFKKVMESYKCNNYYISKPIIKSLVIPQTISVSSKLVISHFFAGITTVDVDESWTLIENENEHQNTGKLETANSRHLLSHSLPGSRRTSLPASREASHESFAVPVAIERRTSSSQSTFGHNQDLTNLANLLQAAIQQTQPQTEIPSQSASRQSASPLPPHALDRQSPSNSISPVPQLTNNSVPSNNLEPSSDMELDGAFIGSPGTPFHLPPLQASQLASTYPFRLPKRPSALRRADTAFSDSYPLSDHEYVQLVHSVGADSRLTNAHSNMGHAAPMTPSRRRKEVSFRQDTDVESQYSAQYPSVASVFVGHNNENPHYVQWLFLCWVLIGVLLTTNLVTCLFVCWTRKSVTSLTDKALSLAMTTRQEMNQHRNGSFENTQNTVQMPTPVANPAMHNSIHNSLNQQFQACHLIQSQRQQRNNTYHANMNNNGNNLINENSNQLSAPKPERLHLELFSPIPSNYSKSYSYAVPKAATHSGILRQVSQR